jgi:diguanylate cyclase (GGDEF)-like protein
MKVTMLARLTGFSRIAIFLALTLFALGEIIASWLAPHTLNSPLLHIFYQSHGLLILLAGLYVANWVSPKMAMGVVLALMSMHIFFDSRVAPLQLTDWVHQAILFIITLLGIRIIVNRNLLEENLKKAASELESQKAFAFKLVDELILINGIATIGVEASNVDDLIEDAVRIIDSALHPDYFDIGLIDESDKMLTIYRSTHLTDKSRLKIPLDKGVVGQVISTGKVSRFPDISLEPSFLDVHPDSRSELCVPLKVGKQVIGVINVESRKLDAFGQSDEHLMMTFADQLVTAIQKVRLFQSEQRHAYEAETLREAGAIVAATLSQEETIQRILAQLKRVLPYDSASVQLLRDGHMEIVGGDGWPDPSAVVGMRFPIPGPNPNTVVVQTGKPYILNDAPNFFDAFREGPHSHIRSFLGVPLIVGKQVIGMLAIDSTRANFFTEDHTRLISAFADQVALAMQNAKLFSDVQNLAHTDSLTGLNNRHYFTELAQREFERARRHRRPLAAIMLDIDHFKNVNDTYGHSTGDQVLREVSARCKTIVRDIDVLGRYGGEEFASLVLETDVNGGQIVAERLRQTVANPPIETDQGPLEVTISVGISILDQECENLDELLRRADQALYMAKQAGRNQVAVWQH